LAFPVLARAFGSCVIEDADVVVCSSSGWSHRVVTSAPKVVYCHNPARWLYQPHDYLYKVPSFLRRAFIHLTWRLRQTDRRAASTATRYLANAASVGDRVKDAYGIEAGLLPPARGLEVDGPQQPIAGIEPGFLLTVGRARGYKHTQAVADAVATLPEERLVVVGGEADIDWPSNVTAVRDISDAEMRWLYSNASGLVAIAHEDFGLCPVEAQAFGVPSVVLRAGGYLETTVEGVTGVFVDEPSAFHVAMGIRRLRANRWNEDLIRRHGESYSRDAFTSRIQDVVYDAVALASR
jgi:glycosyltransferase involved in cell wall biosynthesis